LSRIFADSKTLQPAKSIKNLTPKHERIREGRTMPTKPRSNDWTPGITASAAELEIPLLLALEREPKSTKAIADHIGESAELTLRGLRCLASRHLAHRREVCSRPSQAVYRPSKDAEAPWDILPEERTLCWILSERGMVWRDRQIKHGALEGLDKRFDSLAQVHRSRLALIEAMGREVADAS
jgi:hypothetical protein